MSAPTRLCARCKLYLPADTEYFGTRIYKGATKWRSHCRPCERECLRERRKDPETKSRHLAITRTWNARKRATDPSYIEENKRRSAAWLAANRERSRQNSRRNHIARRSTPEGVERSRSLARAEARRRHNSRKHITEYRLNNSIRSHLRYALLRSKVKKVMRTEALIGYAISDLRKHIERQFVRGMTWENYGEWHIDHIVPLSSFDFSLPDGTINVDEIRKCWSITNLRPLWAKDNLVKNGKRTHLL
jgi:hypothetical protein